jgi:hypothetical protein
MGAEITTIGAAWRRFRSKRAPQVIALALLAAVLARALVGGWSWRDAAAAAAMVVIYPFGEWAIHVHLLHLPPVRGFELPTARAHRMHHEQQARLDLINFSPLEALAVLGLAVPVAVAPLALVLGWHAGLSAVIVAYALVGTYEWTHFLIHTAYRPRSRYYRSIWRAHRLHHFKNEHYWHGITTTIGDRVLGTNPDQRTVARSRTARTLSR